MIHGRVFVFTIKVQVHNLNRKIKYTPNNEVEQIII